LALDELVGSQEASELVYGSQEVIISLYVEEWVHCDGDLGFFWF
jgi:hypothetical protein